MEILAFLREVVFVWISFAELLRSSSQFQFIIQT